LELEGGADAEGMVFAAGVCSEGEDDEQIEIRRYAVTLLQQFFRSKGRELKSVDYRRMLQSIFRHIHRHILEEWRDQEGGLDLALVIADTSQAYAARCGKGDLFLFHEGEAHSLFKEEGDGTSLLGRSSGERMEVEAAPLQPGDILVLCNPAVAGVIRMRDMTLILRRAPDPHKAGLFLSAIAERKGAEGPLTALIWEVPNYHGAALLTEETPPSSPEGPVEGVEGGEAPQDGIEGADLVKKQWLSLWKRRKD